MRLFRRLREKKTSNILALVEKTHLLRRYIFLLIGVVILACSYNLFFYKNNIVYGGASGIAIITKDIVDPSIMIFCINVFLLTLSYFLLGKKETFNSLIGSILFPLFVKLTANICNYIQIEYDNLLLISIVGAVLTGLGHGIIFKSGYTSGGTDILNKIVSKYFKMSIGSAMLIIDGMVVLAGGFTFGWTRVLYAMIVLYIINLMVDKVVLGISSSKSVYITTDEDDLVCDYLLNELNLGITLIETRGGYTNRKDQIIMCVMPTSAYFKVKEGIMRIDPKAVILVTDAYQAMGTYTGSK